MLIRPCTARDANAAARLFHDVVHESCAADYTPEQLDAWAPAERDLAAWGAQLAASRHRPTHIIPKRNEARSPERASSFHKRANAPLHLFASA